jgi:hypothetical protein
MAFPITAAGRLRDLVETSQRAPNPRKIEIDAGFDQRRGAKPSDVSVLPPPVGTSSVNTPRGSADLPRA